MNMKRIEILKAQIQALQGFAANPTQEHWYELVVTFTCGSAGGQKCTLAAPMVFLYDFRGSCRDCCWDRLATEHCPRRKYGADRSKVTYRWSTVRTVYPSAEKLPAVVLACIESAAQLEVLLGEEHGS